MDLSKYKYRYAYLHVRTPRFACGKYKIKTETLQHILDRNQADATYNFKIRRVAKVTIKRESHINHNSTNNNASIK